MSLVVEGIIAFVVGLIMIVNLVGSIVMYVSDLWDIIAYCYDYPNPLSVRFIFTYWWDFIDYFPINIVGKIILITLMTIIFLPMIIVHFIVTLVGFIAMWVCKLFLFIFKEDEEKKILRMVSNLQ